MAEGGVTAKAARGLPVPSRLLAIDADSGPSDPLEVAGRGFDGLLLALPAPLMASGSPISRDLARSASSAGLALLLDLEIDRFPIDHPLVSAHAGLFELRRRRPAGAAVDPRRPLPAAGEAQARLQAPDAERLAPAIGTRLAELVAAGAGGLRLRRPEAVDPQLLAQILAPARELNPGLVVIAHTPGLPWPEVRKLEGFDRFVSSFAYWDGRAPWLAEEYEALRTRAPLLAEVTASAAERIRDEAGRARLALLAAGTGSGFILPPSLSGHARAATALLQVAERYSGEMRLLAADGITGILRGDHSDLRCATEAMVLLVGSGKAREAGSCSARTETVPLPDAEILAALGAEFQPFKRARASRPPLAKLAAHEVRVLVGRRSKPVRRARKPSGAKAARDAAGRARLVIEAISPAVDDGAFAAKRSVGDIVTVEATIFADGHEQLAAELCWRPADQKTWAAARMEELGNDRWRANFPLARVGRFEFAIEAWLDRFGGFRRDFRKKIGAGVARPVDAAEGRNQVAGAADRCNGEPGERLDEFVRRLDRALDTGRDDLQGAADILLDPDLERLMIEADARPFSLVSRILPVEAERLAARFSSWYELFPRSQAGVTEGEKRHGTFDDVIRRLPQIRAMGFDTLYFPPIHPIGRTHRKGRNNTLAPGPADPGSPYAIGSLEGGHDAIHPELGSFEDFRRLIDAARGHGLEIALDFAIQCSPDHPWLQEHPGWFDWRPDGTIKYAENPPKQYEDIVNVDFFNKESIPDLWLALRDVVLFWIGQGVQVFRVDNPHTKPFAFWQWMIGDVRAMHPDVIFLSEAFTRPAVMYRLAKLGFSQSYTYFTWRNGKAELAAYFTELTTGAVPDFFRPHLFVNTPDINPPWLQTAGRAGFRIRAALAATLSGLFGVYSGFELCESEPVPGKEEYHESEKYEIKPRDWEAPGNIIADIVLLNRLRRAWPPLQTHLGLRFYNAWNDQILYYGKQAQRGGEMILVAVSLDPHNAQGADFEVPLWEWGLPDHAAIDVQDLVGGGRFQWSGKVQHMALDPDQPYAIWRLAPPGAAA
ncbi:MAG TPA: alpha-1,4-glucan--maltose-1-phosphate maltosyltransferase [Woeseiaceae bacterium]|nr:alpha-1,4-glucan--maltose-1-phosphate maltosyltransferase [Woeseiaceae bacterium]